MRLFLRSLDTRRLAGGVCAVWPGVGLCMLVAGAGCAEEPSPPPPLTPLVQESSFHLHPWAVDDGTPDNSVMGAVRRADGYLWVVTRAGLFRFDGTRFQAVQAVCAAALPGVTTPVLFEDRRGRMWLSKDNGVIACVDGADVRVFTVRDGVLHCKPLSMAEDGDGTIWFSYYDSQQLCRIKEGRVQAVDAAAALSGEGLTRLVSDSQGQVWFACGRQVGVLRAGRMVSLLTREQPVTCIAAARRGGVWFSDGKQVWKLREGGSPELLGLVPSGAVNLMHEDQRGRLWVATVMEGQPTAALFCHEGRGFRPVPVVCPFINSLADDHEGNLWVGTRRNGLIQVRVRTLELLNPLSPLSAGIRSFCEDTSGRRFAVGMDGSLACSTGAGWEIITADRGWLGGMITCVAAGPRGGVWLGTQQGLFQWRDGEFSSPDNRIAGNIYVRSLLAGSHGDLWFSDGQAPRLYRLRDDHLQEFMLPAMKGTVCALAENAGGGVWAATDDGRLLRDDGDGLTDVTPQGDFPDPIRSLHATPDGSLWIGYETRGLGRLKQGRCFQFGPEQRLEGGAIFQILLDERGWLWCAGDRGIFRMTLAELEAVAAGTLSKLQPVWCGHDEGWPLLKASWDNWPGAARSRSGELCFSMNAGLAVIHPGPGVEAPPKPVVLIDRLSVNGQPCAAYENLVPVSGRAVPPVELRGLTDRLSVGRGVRQMGVEFKVVSFTGQENIRFRYRLEGLDDTWVEAGSQRAAYYSLIPPGRYLFRVSACDNTGIWNEAGAALALTVVPFFWQTTWFKAVCLAAGTVCLVGTGWWGARRRARRRLAEMTQAHAIERERTRIARDMHDEFGSRLTTIANLGEMAMNRSPASAELQSQLGPIIGRVRELINTMDEVVWTVSPENDSLPSLAAFLSDYAERFVAASGISYRLELDPDFPPLPVASEARHNLLLATKEALNNAVRHAAPKVIRLKLHFRNGCLGVVIADEGSGFEVGKTRVGGHGLANMVERMRLINGQAEIRSTPGQGTVVTLSMPLIVERESNRG